MKKVFLFLKKTERRIKKGAKYYIAYGLSLFASTYKKYKFAGRLNTYLDQRFWQHAKEQYQWALALSDKYCRHQFSLLGSGWTTVNCNKSFFCGLENHIYQTEIKNKINLTEKSRKYNFFNRKIASSIRKNIKGDYEPINWHVDFRSGYTWDKNTWYKKITLSTLIGADIKVPWELARMQHLPHLAYAYQQSRKDCYLLEFKNQLIDFISDNPPQYGIHWLCTMEVSIRAVNWLIAYDLFVQANTLFSAQFIDLLTTSIYHHGRHIYKNLEWNPYLVNNHYLSNISGLITICAYLPLTKEIKKWLSFATKEFVNQIIYQFNNDGSNFEGSTHYHVLSTEITTYSFSLLLGLPENKKDIVNTALSQLKLIKPIKTHQHLIKAYGNISTYFIFMLNKIYQMGKFIDDLEMPNGELLQFGDNDSGHLLKLDNPYQETGYQSNLRQHAYVKSICSILTASCWDTEPMYNSEAVIRCLVKSPLVAPVKIQKNIIKKNKSHDILHCNKKVFSLYTGLSFNKDQLKIKVYPDFGLYIYKAQQFFFAVKCGKIGQYGHGGHDHEDQLSFSLYGDQPIFLDKGSYQYTGLPYQRILYRSSHLHTVPLTYSSALHFEQPLFSLSRPIEAQCMQYNKFSFTGKIHIDKHTIYRKISINCKFGEVTVDDYIPKSLIADGRLMENNIEKMNIIPYSSAYGELAP